MAKGKDKGVQKVEEPTNLEVPTVDFSQKYQALKEKMTKDLVTVQQQLQAVVQQQEELQASQVACAKQRIALEALVNYLKATVG